MLQDIYIDEVEVLELLLKLQPDRSPGPDGIHPRVLKECARELARPLATIFQTSILEGQLPKSWK